MNKGLSSFLDFARWASALLVLLTHLNNRMFVRFSAVPVVDRSLGLYLWTFVCGFAHYAVVIFFVLSGFLVGGKLLRDVREARAFDAPKYLVERVTRIYVVLVPVLLMTALADSPGSHLFADTTVYSSIDLQTRLSGLTLMGNLANLQNIFVDPFGTNGPLGTLANEFWYYMTAPLLLAPWMRLKRWVGLALFLTGLALLVLFSVRMPDHVSGFVLWCIGASGAVIRRPIIRRPVFAIAVFFFTVVAIRLGVRSEYLDQYGFRFAIDTAIALSLANVFVCLRAASTFDWPGMKAHQRLAGFSYSLYAVHAPLIMFCCAFTVHYFGFGWGSVPSGGERALAAAAVLVAVLAMAFLLSRLTEAHTGVVRRWALRQVGRQPQPRASA
jgi:peptidoglycan/LPS O-acetylase OafA/YrhL